MKSSKNDKNTIKISLREYLNGMDKHERGTLILNIQAATRLLPLQMINRMRGVSKFRPLEMDTIRPLLPQSQADIIDWTIL
jgi:hypothetical protein